jgi:hypothetical protein
MGVDDGDTAAWMMAMMRQSCGRQRCYTGVRVRGAAGVRTAMAKPACRRGAAGVGEVARASEGWRRWRRGRQ